LAVVRGQVVVDTKIVGADSLSSIDLNLNLQGQGVPQASNLVSNQNSEVLIMQCGTGTFAEADASTCTSCAAGTASAVLGAVSHVTCQSCAAGGFSNTAASVCTPCATNAFSPTPAAGSSATCQACPPNSHSGTGTDSITKCGCDDKFFMPLNVLQPLDPLAPVQFASWAGLAVDTLATNVPHVTCV
jgi:hypothetical protein